MCGVKTNVVTSAEITEGPGNDYPHLAPLLEKTAQNFDISEVSGDKAYLGRSNLQAVHDAGGTAYIPFKVNSMPSSEKAPNPLWDRAFGLFLTRRAEFLEHYHKRSNVESTFSMIKAKFGPAVRTRTPNAQVNEVLVKILCHNICVLVRSMYALGIEPSFKPVESTPVG